MTTTVPPVASAISSVGDVQGGIVDAAAPGIELRSVRKHYGEVVAVADFSLSVARGEFLVLLGPSGCGKTTTLRLIGGFELPTAGEVLIDGEKMGDRPPYRRPVNTVFQDYALFPHMTVGRNVAYGMEMAGVPKPERARRVGEALKLVRLPQVERRKPAELSGGQRQRVALARALVNRPAVLLLDEPLGALDLKLRQAMQGELKRLHREVGATFVYVTHDQDEALTMADRIAVMNEGRLLQLGAPADIYERPRSRFVADFIGQTNFLAVRVLRVDGPVAEVELPGVGTLWVGSAEGIVPGVYSTLAIRPEKIALAGEAPPGAGRLNALDGTLADLVYVGTHTRYVVRLDGGAEVVLLRQNLMRDREEHRPGDALRLVFEPEAAALLED